MAKHTAYGGVVINSEGKVLLRKPTNHFGGYAWTFAKGRMTHSVNDSNPTNAR